MFLRDLLLLPEICAVATLAQLPAVLAVYWRNVPAEVQPEFSDLIATEVQPAFSDLVTMIKAAAGRSYI